MTKSNLEEMLGSLTNPTNSTPRLQVNQPNRQHQMTPTSTSTTHTNNLKTPASSNPLSRLKSFSASSPVTPFAVPSQPKFTPISTPKPPTFGEPRSVVTSLKPQLSLKKKTPSFTRDEETPPPKRARYNEPVAYEEVLSDPEEESVLDSILQEPDIDDLPHNPIVENFVADQVDYDEPIEHEKSPTYDQLNSCTSYKGLATKSLSVIEEFLEFIRSNVSGSKYTSDIRSMTRKLDDLKSNLEQLNSRPYDNSNFDNRNYTTAASSDRNHFEIATNGGNNNNFEVHGQFEVNTTNYGESAIGTDFNQENSYAYNDNSNSTRTYYQHPAVEDNFDPKDAEISQWSSRDFSWTEMLETQLQETFAIQSFRNNQREAINATMARRDVFIIMPTGGGKSLCYQLPAVCSMGVTVVVSPLLSLIQDQVNSLIANDIPAAFLSGEQTQEVTVQIYRDLRSREPLIKLVYVTPEKIAKSPAFLDILTGLYNRNLLARVVIDEAHCVSTWGHDFREDYRKLSILKSNFPKVPLMALTATATQRVQQDIIKQLHMAECCSFTASFNRTNLVYEVRKKAKFDATCDDISAFINENYADASGIIYCFSRNDCQKVKDKLFELGHTSIAIYHSGVAPAEKSLNHDRWSKDEVKIMVATIAFGMGINKPDVRYVIHHSLPRSIEDYYQESGRAGRDGQLSHCILYYTYADKIKQQGFINKDSGTHTRDNNYENLNKVISYCENDTDCRRVIQLAHFGERFEQNSCHKHCDNCKRGGHIEQKDFTDEAKDLVKLVQDIGNNTQSINHCVLVWRGSQAKKIKQFQHDKLDLHGAGKGLSPTISDRIACQLLCAGYLTETVVTSDAYGTSYSRVSASSKSNELFQGHGRVVLSVRSKGKKVGTLEQMLTKASGSSTKKKNAKKILDGQLLEALKKLREQMAKDTGFKPYHIVSSDILEKISTQQPSTVEELLKMQGLTKAKMKSYGVQILECVRNFRATKLGEGTPMTEQEKKQIQEELGDPQRRSLTITSSSISPPKNASRYAQFETKPQHIDLEDDYDYSQNKQNTNRGNSHFKSTPHDVPVTDLTLDDFMNNDDIDAELDAIESQYVPPPKPRTFSFKPPPRPASTTTPVTNTANSWKPPTPRIPSTPAVSAPKTSHNPPVQSTPTSATSNTVKRNGFNFAKINK